MRALFFYVRSTRTGTCKILATWPSMVGYIVLRGWESNSWWAICYRNSMTMPKYPRAVNLFDHRPWHLWLLAMKDATVAQEIFFIHFPRLLLFGWCDRLWPSGEFISHRTRNGCGFRSNGNTLRHKLCSQHGIIVVPNFCETRIIISSSFRLAHSSNPLRFARDKAEPSGRRVNVVWKKKNLS